MCCQDSEVLGLPAEVIEALAHYRRLLAERGWDWGDDRVEMFGWVRFSQFGPVLDAFAETGDWPSAVRRVLGNDVPAGVVVVTVGRDAAVSARCGPARPVTALGAVRLDVVVDSHADTDLTVQVGRFDVAVPARGAAVQTVEVHGGDPALTIATAAGEVVIGDAVRLLPTARLRLSSSRWSRWSVTDASGGAWFPEGVLHKWDVHHRPFFHAQEAVLDVPAEALEVACTRGLEYARVEHTVQPPADELTTMELEPDRLFDPAADGWYGGDLHIHLNYSGDLVCTPTDAARMQLGEGLHLASFVAANNQTALVYDREMLEQYADADLPWTTPHAVARMGVEYRNDLLGHVHALGPRQAPAAYFTGYERTEHDEDWPPNSAGCRELRALGATVGYAHPAFTTFPGGSTAEFFASPRTVEARELVADAALGLVDSIDLISPFNDEGAVFLYHRLLSCGLRLAATAGTDTFLSFSHGPGVASNPPGWGRVYAQLDQHPLSVEAFKDAIRSGRTMATNGPWLTLEVNGVGPGSVIAAAHGDHLDVRCRVVGPGVDRLSIVGPDGVLVETHDQTEAEVQIPVTGPTWVAAVARGPGHPSILDQATLAHTTAVYVDVEGRRVGRAADATWCLDFLDSLEELLGAHGRFHDQTRVEHLADHHALLKAARDYYRAVATGS